MSTTTGNVEITIQDGGGSVVSLPAENVQAILGCSSAGTANMVLATRSPKVLQDSCGYGPGPEYAALAALSGGVVLFVKVATNTAGAVTGSAIPTVAITGATHATPIVVTAAGHGLVDGAVVTIAGVGGNTVANGTHVAHVLSSSTFELVGTIAAADYTTGGTLQFTGLIFSGTGTSVPTLTGTPLDAYYGEITITKGGTRGTDGIEFTLSLDAGRTSGSAIQLGTATTYAIPQTGLTWALAAGTLVAGDTIRFSTSEPAWNDAGLAAALAALQASPYASTGWGSLKIVGPAAGADATAIQSGSPGLEQLAAGQVFTRAMIDARDAHPPTAWGGAGETESAWMTSIETSFSAVDAKRVMCSAGHYNITSAYANPAAGLPRFRRPGGWAVGCRQVGIPPQRHAGRVRDGSLAQFVIDPLNDPSDGFLYHDERINPGLDKQQGGAGRFCSFRTRIRRPGFFVCNPLLLSPLGSKFLLLPHGLVMDVAATIAQQTGEQSVNDDVRLNANGTIYKLDGDSIEIAIEQALKDNMTAKAMISSATVTVDRDWNVLANSSIPFSVSIISRGYLLEINGTLAYANAQAA